MRDDEARSRGPRIGGEAALAPERGEIFAIDERERQAELGLKLVLPLADHSGRRGHENEIDAPPQKHFAEDQARLDGLAGADVVGDQQVDPRQPQRLSQRKKLIGIEVDAGAERRLEQVPVGGGRRVPAERAQIGGEDRRIVGAVLVRRLPQPSSCRTEASSSASQRTSTVSPWASSSTQARRSAVKAPICRSSSTSHRRVLSRTKSPRRGINCIGCPHPLSSDFS